MKDIYGEILLPLNFLQFKLVAVLVGQEAITH